MPINLYCTLAEVRAEGVDATAFPDVKVNEKIRLASTHIENVTGHWFGAKDRTLRIDGIGGTALPVHIPIVKVDTVTLLFDVQGITDTLELDPESLQVYNRHLTMGLTNPDDRDAPRIELRAFSGSGLFITKWPKGEQNIQLAGTFGYTELDSTDTVGETVAGNQIPVAQGVVPADILDVCLRLVVRNLPDIGDTDATEDEARRGDTKRVKTRDQEIEYFGRQTTEGFAGLGLTGDATIDGVLSRYMRSLHMAFV